MLREILAALTLFLLMHYFHSTAHFVHIIGLSVTAGFCCWILSLAQERMQRACVTSSTHISVLAQLTVSSPRCMVQDADVQVTSRSPLKARLTNLEVTKTNL